MRRHWFRFVDRARASIVVLGSLGLTAASSRAQSPTPTPSPDEYAPARFIAADGLFLYAEFDGLDAHAEGWRKTAAYRLLNETTTGAMLEDLFGQVVPRSLGSNLTGPEKLQVVKHVAQAGFTIGLNAAKVDDKVVAPTVLILHDAFANKEVRPLFARLLQGLPDAGTKAQAVVKAGHKMISGQHGKDQFFWWVEESRKEDLIFVSGQAGVADYVLDTYDGKRPSFQPNALRADLNKGPDGFERTGFGFIDLTVPQAVDPSGPMANPLAQIKIDRVDYRGGFQGDALMTVTRMHSAAARAAGGSGTGFDRATIPGIPPGVLGLMVVAPDLKALPATLRANPAIGPQYDRWVATLKEKSKVRFEEDVLAQLGPKVTAYVAPSKAATAGGPTLPNALGLLSRLGAAGPESIPKLAVLIDVANPVKFTNTLDGLVSFANRQLKGAFAQAPPGGPGADGMQPPPGPGRGRGRDLGGPAPEFRVMGGEAKSYVFTVPPELSGTFPASFRPTIRVGARQVAVALSAEVARQAIDAKGPYTPPAEVAPAFARLPARLNWLLVVDPRESTPEILASLPAKLQAGVNTLMTAAPPANAAGTPAAGSPPANRPAGRLRKPGMAMGEPEAGPASTPGTEPASTPAPGAAPTPGGPLVLQVSPDKLPAADAIRKILFPAMYTLDEDGDAIRFTSRVAFPPIPDPSVIGLLARAYRARAIPAGIGGLPGTTPAPSAAPVGASPAGLVP